MVAPLAPLRIRLLLLVLVAVVPILGIVVLSAREQREVLIERASREATTLAEVVAERHQRSVDTARGLLLGMAQMEDIAGLDGATCSAKLAPLLASEPVFVNMGAARVDGKLFCTAAPARSAIDLSDRKYFRDALASGGMGVSGYIVTRVRGIGAITFGYPVRNASGEVVAVAFASLAVTELQRALEDLPLPAGAEIAVLDRSGVTVSARPEPARWVGKPFDPELVAAVEGSAFPVTLAGTDGVVRLYTHRDITAPDGTTVMHVIGGIPTAAIVDPVNRVSNRALLGSLLVAAFALAAAGLMAEFTLVRRLRRLSAASKRIASGDLSARTGLPARHDELGELVASFDGMAQALESLEREKRRNEEQLRQAQKMEVVGHLAGGVAHDFNNLLTVIVSAASAIRQQVPPGDPIHEDAREVLHAGERAASLTRQLLAFSRRQSHAPRVVELGATARSMERLLERVLGEAIVLRVTVRAPAVVFADPGQIELALLNLSMNARDAMPRGGRLDIEVDALAADDPRRPAGADVPAGPLASLIVRDTGVGIDPAIRGRIFEPFFTTKGPGRGTGLGLSTVLGIVEQARGVIRVHSEESCGAEFQVCLPLHAGEPGEARDEAQGAPLGRGETILLVEDDERLRAMLRRTLHTHGYRVLEARTTSSALAVAAEQPEPALVLTDVVLPEGNGVALARELSRRWPGVRVMFMSGHAGNHLSALDAITPPARVLSKPFTPEALLAAIREVLRPRVLEAAAAGEA